MQRTNSLKKETARVDRMITNILFAISIVCVIVMVIVFVNFMSNKFENQRLVKLQEELIAEQNRLIEQNQKWQDPNYYLVYVSNNHQITDGKVIVID